MGVTARPGPPLTRPLFSSRVPAGFPSPAEEYAEGPLDLHRHLIRHPAATFSVRVTGHSLTGAGILDGELLVAWPAPGCRRDPDRHRLGVRPPRRSTTTLHPGCRYSPAG